MRICKNVKRVQLNSFKIFSLVIIFIADGIGLGQTSGPLRR